MIITLTPNPALDITYRVPRVALGESHRVGDVVERAGGKGLNTASVLAAMARECVAIAPVGEESVASFGADLTSRSVPHVLVPSSRRTRRSVAVVDESGMATLFNEPGDAIPPHTWDEVIGAVRRAAASARVLTVSGSLPPGAPSDLVRRLTTEAHDAGLRVVLDISGQHLTRALGAAPDIVKPNRAEATATFGGSLQTLPSAAELALALTIAGARAAIVSDGTAGLTLVTGDVKLRAWLAKPLRGNATGAGDALTAALAVDLDEGGALAGFAAGSDGDVDAWGTALRRAVAWSAAAVLQPVAGAVDPDHIDRVLPTVELEEITP